MPALLISVLIWFASSLIARVLIGAGLGMFTYSAIQTAFDTFKGHLIANASQMPADVLQLCSLLSIDYYISVVLGALSCATFIMVAKVFVGKA